MRYTITSVEYYESKYDVVDNEEFTLAVDDPLFPPELIEEVPAPRNLKILREPEFNNLGKNLIFYGILRSCRYYRSFYNL